LSLPKHVAIIMDGNGRWAQSQGRIRNYGHLKGARVARKIIEQSTRLGISYLTLYAFSTENWLRPKAEVSFLMRLLEHNIRRERANLVKNNIKFQVIGTPSTLPAGVTKEVQKTIAATAQNTGMVLTFAINYGGRKELVNAVQEIVKSVEHGQITSTEVDEALIEQHLFTKNMPDPDLVIRTSGEFRISNFLIWQSAYSEFYITPVSWPEFDQNEYLKALQNYQTRERRFGKISPTQPPAEATGLK